MECINQTLAIWILQNCTSLSPICNGWLFERKTLCFFHFLPLLPSNRTYFLSAVKCYWPRGRRTVSPASSHRLFVIVSHVANWGDVRTSSGDRHRPPYKNPCSQPRQPYYQFQTKMDPVPSRVIHDILPTELLEIIFEEHAKLEWEAPTIDGRVCRLWRRIVLNTPRAWAYLEIRNDSVPSMDEVRLRLHRSNPAPLHIDICVGQDASRSLYDLFNDHHTRIASLRMRYGSQSFFEGRDFPRMRLLEVAHWCPVRWGSMPELQSLLLGTQLLGQLFTMPLGELD